ncbi:tetraacyldisaccharide 4'-kinase [Salegentibacter sediminis]|uniref:tetraacyldisaccharide 4'-kinase n=1 Tax=Salegentibacter sediminis TaxID=1930251 RepID=UPI0009C0D0AB|nr:tetraacyldisaccharide 4'-kinase [Salegentibacter sediminis]
MELFRKILLPFSLLYGFVMLIRNFLYDSGVLKSKAYKVPVICVGNLNTGGTGKSPMIEFLLKVLGKEYRIASLSRGYKRETRGYRLLKGTETAAEVGDEPLQFKKKFPEAFIAVDANRQNGISQLLKENPEVILLDDAFQHRKVKAGFNILLTAFGDLFTDDFMLPTGNLREPGFGAERADIILVTKCPVNLSRNEQEHIRTKLELRNYQELFFTSIRYSEEIVSAEKRIKLEDLKTTPFTLVTGIANPEPLLKHLEEEKLEFEHKAYGDHHNFSFSEISELQNKNLILTTEKDYMRLQKKIAMEKLFYLPIEVSFINGEMKFLEEILAFVNPVEFSERK